jgi:hypothetical protein
MALSFFTATGGFGIPLGFSIASEEDGHGGPQSAKNLSTLRFFQRFAKKWDAPWD